MIFMNPFVCKGNR